MTSVIEAYNSLQDALREHERLSAVQSEIESAKGTNCEEAAAHYEGPVEGALKVVCEAEDILSKTKPETVYELLLKLQALMDNAQREDILEDLRSDLKHVLTPPDETDAGRLKLPIGYFDEPKDFGEALLLFHVADKVCDRAFSASDDATEEFGARSPQEREAEAELKLAINAYRWADKALRNHSPTTPKEAAQKLAAFMDPASDDAFERELKEEALEFLSAAE